MSFDFIRSSFVLFKDDETETNKQIICLPLKVRRQTNFSSIVVNWDLESMNVDQIGPNIEEKE